MEEELKKMMGVCNTTPAEATPAGTVEEGGYGMVALLDDHRADFSEVPGSEGIGYYDDDDVNEDSGFIEAIVYFGEPFGDGWSNR